MALALAAGSGGTKATLPLRSRGGAAKTTCLRAATVAVEGGPEGEEETANAAVSKAAAAADDDDDDDPAAPSCAHAVTAQPSRTRAGSILAASFSTWAH